MLSERLQADRRLLSVENSGSLAEIASLYGLAKLTMVKKVESGILSHNFIVSDGNSMYFLKEHRHEEESKIHSIQEVEEFFKSGGIPIVMPMLTQKGDRLFEDNGRFYSLFPFVEGKTYRRENATETALKSAGALLGQIHLLSKDKLPDIDLEKTTSYSESGFFNDAEKIKKDLAQKSELDQFDKDVLAVIEEKENLLAENKIDEEKLNLGQDHLIHGDYKLTNMFFDEDDNVKWLFDTEKTEIAPRMIELVKSLDLICFNDGFEERNFKKAEDYLQSYNSVYPIEIQELADAVRFLYIQKLRSLWVPKEYYNGNTRVAKILQSEMLVVRYRAEHLEEFIERITSLIPKKKNRP